MQASPVELLFYYVEELHWKVEAGFDSDQDSPLQAEDIEWQLQSGGDDEGDPRKAAYRLRLALPSRESRFPYSFEIVMIGFFQLNDSVPDDQVARILDANAPAVLYGAAREALANSIGRGPFRPLLLPAVHFLGMERESKSTTPAKKPAKKKAIKAKTTRAK